MRVLPGRRGDPRDVGPVLPPRLASGGVQPVVVNVAHAPGRDELCQLGDEIWSVPQSGVLLEVGIGVGMVEDLSAGPVVAEFLQDKGDSCRRDEKVPSSRSLGLPLSYRCSWNVGWLERGSANERTLPLAAGLVVVWMAVFSLVLPRGRLPEAGQTRCRSSGLSTTPLTRGSTKRTPGSWTT